jgi:AcrR family transcriptional regulator
MAGRDALLDAAFEELVSGGPALPASAVARRAGVSKALLFHHFGDREGLLDAMAARVLGETQEGLARLVADYPNPRERLAALARTLLEAPTEPSPGAARHVLSFWLASGVDGRPRGALRDELLAGFVADIVREGVATGALRASAGAAPVVDLLLARWHGLTVLQATGREVDHDGEQERLVADLARLAFP